MPDNALSTPAQDERQERRTEVVGGSVNGTEKEKILRALDNSGWTQSSGVRTVMLAFVESAEVRDAVFAHVRRQTS